jgi:hypothetical protein
MITWRNNDMNYQKLNVLNEKMKESQLRNSLETVDEANSYDLKYE